MMNGEISTQLMRVFKLVFIGLLFILPETVLAQYDYEHYVPPFYCSSQVGKQEVFLSTNSENDLKVFIEDGQGNTVAGPFTISRAKSETYVFNTPEGATYSSHNSRTYPDGCSYSYGIIGPKELNTPLNGKGLRIYSYDGPFFANIRHGYSNDGEGKDLTHGFSLSSKGAIAKGTDFYSGHLYNHTILDGDPLDYYEYYSRRWNLINEDAKPIRSHSISVMAVEDNVTTVTFSGLKCKYITKYEGGKVVLKPISPNETITVDLTKGQSYTIGVNMYSDNFASESLMVRNGMNGTHITSSQKIVVNCGSWTAGAQPSQDIGFDQIVPSDQVRDKYIVMKGEGRAEPDPSAKHAGQERTIIVATQANTEVWVNENNKGSLANPGDFMILDDIVNPTAIPTLYIDTKGKDVYVYQTMCGTNQDWTNIGLNFIPPLTGLGIKEVVIPKANCITSGDTINPTVTVLAQKNVDVQRNGISLSNPQNVPGTTEWVYYKVPNISGDCRFTGSKAINVAWTASSNTLGAAGYYSGFTKAVSPIHPVLNIDTELSLVCESYDENIGVALVEPLPDFYEWYVNDYTKDPFIENQPLLVPAPDVETLYHVIGYYRDPSLDLLFNGDFSDGFNGFDSDYDLVNSNLVDPGDFALASSPVTENSALADFSAMDGGRMFLGYSDRQGEVVYQVNELPVEENFSYIFKLYGRLAQNSSLYNQTLKVLINDEVIVDGFKIDKSTEWQAVSALWKPGTERKATIKILNHNLDSQDTFFALDSISFVQAVQDTATFTAKVVPNFSYGSDGDIVHFCKGVPNSLDVSNGDTSWYDYSWSKGGVNLVDGAVYSGVKSHELIFANPQEAQEGEYKCTIGFKTEYQDCGTSGATVDVNLTVFVDEAATVKLGADKVICSGVTTDIYASITGDAGTVMWYVSKLPDELEEFVGSGNSYKFLSGSGTDHSAGLYNVRCEAINGCGTSSGQLTIDVKPAPELTGLTVNDLLCEGTEIVLTAETSDVGDVKYYWQKDGESIDFNGSTYRFNASVGDENSEFSVGLASVYTIGEDAIECRSEPVSKTLTNINPQIKFTALKDITSCVGETKEFKVIPNTSGTYFYAWYKGEPIAENILSTTTAPATKLFSPVKEVDAGLYTVKVWNDCYKEASSAELIVAPKLLLTDISVLPKGPFCNATDVTVTFNDNGAVSAYKAKKPDGSIITISNPYTFNVNSDSQGKWQFMVEGNCGVNPDPKEFDLFLVPDFGTLSIEPQGACLNSDVSFEAKVGNYSDLSELTYLWTNEAGVVLETESVLTIENVQESDLGIYTCTVTDRCRKSVSESAVLSIEKVTSKANETVIKCVDDKFSIDIDFVGDATFIWYNPKGEVIAGEDDKHHFEINSVTTDDSGTYECVVSLACGNDVSIKRTLVVNEHISIDDTDAHLDFCESVKPLLKIDVVGSPVKIEWKDNGGTVLKNDGTTTFQLDLHTASSIPYMYSVTVTGLCETLTKTFYITVHDKPTITPVDPIVACEGDIPLSIVVTGTDYRFVEWWNSDETTKFGTGLTYTIPGATDPASEGTYIAKVTTEFCDVVKTDVLVSIHEPIRVTSTSNLNPTPCEGAPLSLVVNAIGDGVEYEWYETTTPGVTLSTSNTLNLGIADASDNNSYTCKVNSSNACLGATRVFNVLIKDQVDITTQPSDLSICASASPADFTIVAAGDGTLVYTWYDKDDNVVGGNSSTLSIANPLANDGQNYYCIVSGSCNDKKSDKASLLVKEEVVITDHPDDVKIADGGNATFSVFASGDPTITYQWQESVDGTGAWTNISDGGVYSGATSPTLTMTGVDKGTYDTNKYRCVVNNGCTPANSNPAVLTIDLTAKITIQPNNFDACVGNTGKSFTINAAGTGLGYLWKYRQNSSDAFGTISAGMTLSNGDKTLTLPAITAAMKDWEFQCTVSGTGSPDISNVVKVKVYTLVTFVPIDNVILCNGTGAHFETKILAGSAPYNYLWERGVTNLGTNSQLSLSATDATDATYQLSVGNGICPATTDNFNITHYTDLDLNPWTNGNETCVGEIPAEELAVTLASSDGGLTQSYSWTKDSDPAVLGTSSTYILPGTSSIESGLYKVVVFDKCSSKSITGFVNVYDPIAKINVWDATKTLCLGADLTLDVKVSGDNPTYAWTYPNGARPAVGNKPSLKFNTLTLTDDGVYTCTVTNSCASSVVYTIDVTILKAPVITTGIDAIAAVCEGDPLALGPITVNGTYDNLIWTLNDNSTNAIAGTTLNLGTADLSEAGNYKVTVTNICGSDASLGKQVVNSILALDPIESQTVCAGNDVVFRANATGSDLSYVWTLDGAIVGSNSSELVLDASVVLPFDLNASKTYTVVCDITSTTGCGGDSKTTTLLVKPNTVLHATLKNVVKYVGESYTMTVDVSGVDLVFQWTHELADGTKVPLAETGATVTLTDITMGDAGYYTCKIVGACGQRLASGKLTVKEPVTIISGLNAFEEKCVGDPLNLSISATGQISSIKWFKNNVLIPLETSLNLYIAAVSLTDGAVYKCEIEGEGITVLTETTTVRVYSQTVLNSPLENQILCEGAVLEWIPDVDGSNLMFEWTMGGVNISDQKILHYDAITLSNEGNYEVQVTSMCGDVSSSANLEIIQLPAYVSSTAGKIVCENEPLVEFSVEYTGEKLKYQWRKDGVDIPRKTAKTLSLTNIKLSDEGDYNCKVSSTCGEEFSPVVTLTVTPQLQVLSDMVDREVCTGEDVLFTADVVGNNVNYQWKVDGVDVVDVPGVISGANTSVLSIVSSQVAHSGYYTCILSDDCTDYRSTKPTELVVHALPNTAIYGRMVLCAKEDRVTYVLNQVGADVYTWDVEGGIFAGSEDGARTRVTWAETSPGSLSVTIMDLVTGCTSKIDSAVVLNGLPVVNLTSLDSKGVCEKEFKITGGFPEGGIYWVNGISQTVFNPSYRGAGTYAVHYSYTDKNGCSNVTPITNLNVDVLPVVDITDDVTVGSCNPTPLTAKTDENNIQWFKIQDNNRVLPNNLNNANSMNPIFTPGKSQVLVAMVKDEHGCEGIDLLNLSVAPLPVVTTINDTTVGQCNQLLLQTDIVGDQDVINWTNPDHLDHADVRSPRIIDAPAGTHTYTINVTDLYGCDAAGEVTVTMVADPTLGEDQFGCEGDKYEIDITGKENPVWDDNYTSLLRTIDTPGQYLLEVSNKYGCGDEQLFVINPKANLGLRDTLVFEGQTVTFAPNLPSYYAPYFFEWQDGSIDQRFEVSKTGTYKLKVEDNLGCVAIDSAYVEVKPVGIESSNAFLPLSGDGINDMFYLGDGNLNMGANADERFSIIEDFEMYVYDRWGELLFKTKEQGYKGGWNGQYKGKLCPAGAYVWIVFINGDLTNKGTFMLIR
jgi:gliding motility-associated-like protein